MMGCSATWLPSPNFSAAQRKVGDVRGIVIHDLEGGTAGGIATLRTPGGVSAHYIISESGAIYQLVEEGSVAYHVAAWGNQATLNRNRPSWLPAYNGLYSASNAATIGIELAGYAAKGYQPAQYVSLGHLLASLCDRWQLTPSLLCDDNRPNTDAVIVTHAYLQTDRSDPGLYFDWEQCRAALAANTPHAAHVTPAGPAAPATPPEEAPAVSPEDQALVDAVHASGIPDVAAYTDLTNWASEIYRELLAEQASNADLNARLAAAATNAPPAVVRVLAPPGITVVTEVESAPAAGG